jgi:hypothetical protein
MSKNNEDESGGVSVAVGTTLATALALMFTRDEDAMHESVNMISAGIFTLVKGCASPEQAIGIALACALGSALIGDAVDDLVEVTDMMAKDGEHFEQMKLAFHDIINSIQSNDMSESKSTGTVH